MILTREAYLMHYGILRKSGRYPWGSGETQSARNRSFLDTIDNMRREGMTDVQIANAFSTKEQPFNTSDLRALKSIATNQEKMENIARAQKLKDKGMSNVEIGKNMGINESSVRSLLAPGAADRANIVQSVSDMLKREVESKEYLDVGAQSGAAKGINDTTMKVGIAALREEGYKLHYVKIRQLGTGQETTYKVLTKPDVPYSQVFKNRDQIKQITEATDDNGRSFFGNTKPPLSVSSSRIGINYKEDGGSEADGVIFVRPGVKDLDMGGVQYAQVRIKVDETHYLKGMAVYKDNLPEGHDLVFNTNKSRSSNKLDAMKPLKIDKLTGKVDEDNPFGAVIDRQIPKYDKHGQPIKDSVGSAINIVNDDASWGKWSKNLSTQFLSKQSPTLAKEQLDMTYERKVNELKEISGLTNPAVKRKLLEGFAEDADSSSVHLKAMGLPRQRAQVIMPVQSLKENEIYAPNYKNGERVVLVRHPHAGTFELPELTVNNKNVEGQKLLGKQAKTAVGINHKVAARLSGADFDGDTVLVLPNNNGKIKTQRALEGLKGFDPQHSYKAYDGMRTIDGGYYDGATGKVDYRGRTPVKQTMQKQMGLISNLITDMTIAGANNVELAAAVRHSMVVIDAEKHHLDYKRSAKENNIPALTKKYQPRDDGLNIGSSSTLISRAKSEVRVAERKQGFKIDPTTGRKMFTDTDNSFVNDKGETVFKTTKSSKLAEAKNAHDLISVNNTRIENIYADHSNRLKELANQARLEQLATKSEPSSKSAKTIYAPQVKSLLAKLAIAEQNAPRERQAQVVANQIVGLKRQAYPDMEPADLKKIKGQALVQARARTGAGKTRINIEDGEWAAIQAGALTNHQMQKVIQHSDLDRLKELATPRESRVMSSAMQSRAKSMLESGYTQADVAAQLGVSLSTLKDVVIEKE